MAPIAVEHQRSAPRTATHLHVSGKIVAMQCIGGWGGGVGCPWVGGWVVGGRREGK